MISCGVRVCETTRAWAGATLFSAAGGASVAALASRGDTRAAEALRLEASEAPKRAAVMLSSLIA